MAISEERTVQPSHGSKGGFCWEPYASGHPRLWSVFVWKCSKSPPACGPFRPSCPCQLQFLSLGELSDPASTHMPTNSAIHFKLNSLYCWSPARNISRGHPSAPIRQQSLHGNRAILCHSYPRVQCLPGWRGFESVCLFLLIALDLSAGQDLRALQI